jgi:hypothetical protein
VLVSVRSTTLSAALLLAFSSGAALAQRDSLTFTGLRWREVGPFAADVPWRWPESVA